MIRQDRVVALISDYLKERVVISKAHVNELHLEINKGDILILAERFEEWDFPLIQITATDERGIHGYFRLFYTFANDHENYLIIVTFPVTEAEPSFPSITNRVPAAHWYEREIKDLFGLDPVGHPDKRCLAVHEDWPEGLFPLRKDFDANSVVPRTGAEFSCDKVEGEGVMQVPVGPIHAGIIEPGHFRFSAVGDTVINLEARLFYTHRGLEKLVEGKTPLETLPIVERICGACSFSHATAYCQALEKISAAEVSPRVQSIRTIALELERLYNHVGDVGNICAGVGFAFGTMHGARLKEDLMRLNEEVFGSRFLRGINIPGGVRRDISGLDSQRIVVALEKLEQEFRELVEILLNTNSYLDRVETTGVLLKQTAVDFHAVGPAARAAGVNRDLRRDHPYAAYDRVSFKVPVYDQGDVLARIKVRIDETFESLNIIRQVLASMPIGALTKPLGEMTPYQYAIGMTESARGENVHFVMIDEDKKIYRYMVRSASYVNWPVVPTTVPGNIIPDFPVINKSFELCYSCLDR
ncbi:Ni,Fe-hydrogenase III large subunit [Desulfosporosinus orientis DSM 765]|uniref:Ni,Fe-hydrogenase III large subunit n=1 Tax=Desulfosporosinus orientis (strain ATCC 19365 / DSM 765 / NCIMB 8382 / VKM B-1628 / Singapore I) TaxID=768706 RepID=G7WEP0_DESOD|nr:NADH-quinone oxidoreductase subunit C [Desulfosporosinus orientis]AET66931.1 Ni,Fe-hydrogenase III large subunit [Desulfosporosinus orientis DSM 765]